MSDEMTPELQEIIASLVADRTEIEVIRISEPQIDTLWISSFVPQGTQVIDQNGLTQTVDYVPMTMSEPSIGKQMTASRVLSIVALNDLIADQQDKIAQPRQAKITVDIFTYIMDDEGVLSTIALGPIRNYVNKIARSEKHNGVNLYVSTSPTNQDETGVRSCKRLCPGMEGFE